MQWTVTCTVLRRFSGFSALVGVKQHRRAEEADQLKSAGQFQHHWLGGGVVAVVAEAAEQKCK